MQQSVIFGNLQRTILDRGTVFPPKNFDNYCKDQEVEHIIIVMGIPRRNAQVERINRIVKPILTKLSVLNPAEWHKYISNAQQYINNTSTRSTGTAPYTFLLDTHIKTIENRKIKNILKTRILNYIRKSVMN